MRNREKKKSALLDLTKKALRVFEVLDDNPEHPVLEDRTIELLDEIDEVVRLFEPKR